MNITLLNILGVDILESRFETQFVLKMSWLDSRLRYSGLKEQEHKNWVTKAENIWKPKLK